MPDFNWRCLICDHSVPAGLDHCEHCGCPANVRGQDIAHCKREYEQGRRITLENRPEGPAPTHRPDGSNIIPWQILLKSSFGAVALIVIAASFVAHHKAAFRLGRRSHTIVELVGMYSSWLACLGLLAASASLVTVVIDHFDRRKNEHQYKRFGRVMFGLSLVLVAAAVLVACLFEKVVVRGY
jgi:hypothetical protein